MNHHPRSLIALVLATSVALGACTSAPTTAGSPPETSPPATSEPVSPETTQANDASSSTIPSAVAEAFDLDDVLERITSGYATSSGKWTGFEMKGEPVVLALADPSGRLLGALTINHPAPSDLGDAVRLDGSNDDLGEAFLVTNLVEAEAKKLEGVGPFDFHHDAAGVDSFAMIAGGGDSFFDPLTNDYTSTLVHEVFHRWQDKGFEGGIGGQDVDGYAYTADNIALAALEERIITAALAATTDAERMTAVRQVAAIRLVRRAADPRVELDDSQERFEGTARYLEHALAGDNTDYAYHQGNHGGELIASPAEAGGVKEYYGFGRFYASGAALLELAQRIGVDDPTAQINAGASPIDLLIEATGVSEQEVDALVAEARATHDPENSLPAAASAASEQAKSEPGVFDDVADSAAAGSPGGEPSDEGAVEITDTELECLAEQGFDIEGNGEITDEMFETCL